MPDEMGGVPMLLRRLIAPVLGCVMALGLAPFSLGPLAFAAVTAILYLAIRVDTAKRAAAFGWFAGLGYFGLGLHWIVEPFFVEAAVTGWMAPFALVGLAGGLALFWAGAFWTAARLGGGVWRFAVFWAVFEMLRGFVFTGFPWALPSHIWSGTAVLQWGALLGPYGLSLVTLLAAALPVWAWQRQNDWLVPGALSFGAWAALLGGGLWLQGGKAPEAPDINAPVVRLIQPNAPQHEKWDPEMMPVFFERMVSFSEAEPAVDLVVWPESSLPTLLHNAEPALRHIAERAQAQTVIGLQRRAEQAGAYYNSLVLSDADGAVQALYDKHHLVPFGEYMPLPALWNMIGVRALAERTESGYVSGGGPQLLDIPNVGRALPLICYEAVFARHTNVLGARADFLMQITNDAWFGAAVGPWQHLEQARMRAIEQGLPMVRVANTGVSAVIDAKGRIVGQLALNTAGYLDLPLPEPAAPTLYARTGEAVNLVLLFLLVIGTFLTGRVQHVDPRQQGA